MPSSKLHLVLLFTLAIAPLSCAGIKPPHRLLPLQPVFAVCDPPSSYDQDADTLQNGEALRLVVGEGARQHTLVVPPGAAPAGTRFVLEQVPGAMAQVNVEAFPDQTFASEVILSLSFEGCRAPGKPDKSLQIYRFDTTTGVWEPRPGRQDSAAPRRVTLRTNHLSGYVLAAAD